MTYAPAFPADVQDTTTTSHSTLPQCLRPWQAHAIWQLLKTQTVFDQASAERVGKEIFQRVSEVEIVQLFEIAIRYGWVIKKRKGWEATEDGISFANSKHWRLWHPPANIGSRFEKDGIRHYFIGERVRPQILDLFAGAGGLGLGFEMAGFEVKAAVEIDPQAQEAHERNFPDSAVISENIVDVARNPSEVLQARAGIEPGKLAGIVGGPPCQGFSFMGERAASDERNLLTSRFMDIVLDLQPDFFVMENVQGLLSSGEPPELHAFLSRMGKNIGEPASLIAESLPIPPKAVAKRQRQYLKRFVSGQVDDLRVFVQEGLESLNNWTSLPPLVLDASRYLRENMAAAFARSEVQNRENERQQGNSWTKNVLLGYDSGTELAEAHAVLERKAVEIFKISLGVVVAEALAKKVLNKNECHQFLQQLASHQEAEGRIAQTLLDEFDGVPSASDYRGVRMGPVLRHLIDRALPDYEIEAPQVLISSHFGAPQERKRLFLVGIHRRLGRSFSFPRPVFRSPNARQADTLFPDLPLAPTAGEALDDLPNIDFIADLIQGDTFEASLLRANTSEFAAWMRLDQLPKDDFSLPRPTWNPFVVDNNKRTLHDEAALARIALTPEGAPEGISGRKRLHRNLASHTLRAGTREGKGSHTAVRPLHYEHHRVISVREGARLMGFPDWMTFHPTKWHGFRLVGNGVPAQLGQAVAKQIYDLLYF